MKKIKLDLGGGRRPKRGYTNVDKWEGHYDVYCDFEKGVLPYEDNSVDEIYTHHMLEHLPWYEADGPGTRSFAEKLLGDCYRVLKYGGRIEIAVPDFEEACSRVVENNNINLALMMIYSSSTDNPFDIHRSGYTTKMMESMLAKTGFDVVSIDYPEWYGRNIHVIAEKGVSGEN